MDRREAKRPPATAEASEDVSLLGSIESYGTSPQKNELYIFTHSFAYILDGSQAFVEAICKPLN